jgi:serine/threonine protein kinase
LEDLIASLAPEVKKSKGEIVFTEKVDVWAFGLILHDILVAVSGSDARNGIDGERMDVGVSEECRELMEKCMSPNPEERPSFDEIFRVFKETGFPLFSDVVVDSVKKFLCEIEDFEKMIAH